MPELPEVETVRRTLEPRLKSKTITSVNVYYTPLIKTHTVTEFTEILVGKTFRSIGRIGKYLLFNFDEYTLISHLRMEGKYYIKPSDSIVSKHEHLRFNFADGTCLAYNDVRKFGTFDLKHHDALYHTLPLSKLGLEPFNPAFNAQYLKQKFKHKKQAIKPALLDQTIVLGLGNIYVDEVLFCAKLHPEKKAHTIGLKRLENIVQCSQAVLHKAIDLGGSSIRSYTDSLGVTGRFQNQLNVHMQLSKPCPLCGNLIEKIKVSGRGTYFCKQCQSKR